ncbi:hypothetical protein AB0903_28470 [Streptomyces sp. NPDC048389]|uniref:hypothetical protein n=1 Tax=Streptomyces sp. NPDC048389 TaxID=3154622 RepID=UPI0034530CFE
MLLAAVGHIFMSGAAVSWWAMAVAGATTAAIGWSLADRERGVLFVTSTVVAAQAALHCAFSLAQAAVHPSVSDGTSFARQWARNLLCRTTGSDNHLHEPARGTTGTVMPGAGEHAHHTAQVTTDSTALPAAHDMGGMSPTGMLAAHALAALLCGLWLAYGEQAAFRLLRAFTGRLVAPLRLVLSLPAPPHRPRIRLRRRGRSCAPRQLLLVDAITSRGPPSGIAVI